MPANHKVSVAWQIVFTFIPIVNFWAFYRIRKLLRYLLYVILPSAVLSIIFSIYAAVLSFAGAWVSQPQQSTTNGSGMTEFTEKWPSLPPLSPEFWYAAVIGNIISFGFQGFAIYLVIIWSRQHNRQFDQPTSQSAAPAA